VAERTSEQEPGVREDAVPKVAAVSDFGAPVAGFVPASAGALAALPPALRAASVARLQASAGNAAVARVLGRATRTAAREPQRCACGGVIGADGQCDRCREQGKPGSAPASPSEAMARMIAEDARQAAAQSEPERPPEPGGPPKRPPAWHSAHDFPLADTIATPDGIQARAADAQALAAAPAPPPQAHAPPALASAAPILGAAHVEGPTTTIRTADTVARLVDSNAGAGGGPAVPEDTSKELERVKTTVADTEASAQQAGESAGAAAITQIEQAPQQLQTRVAPLEQSGAELATNESRTAQAQGALATQSADQLVQESTQAATEVTAVEPLAPALLSPARAIVKPAAVEADGGRIGEVGRSLAGGAPAGGDFGATATQTIGAGAQPLWNCDLAEVVAIAGGIPQSLVAGAVNLAERAIGPARLAQVREFGANMGRRVTELAQRFGVDLSALSGLSGERFTARARSATETVTAAATGLRQRFASFRAGAAQAVEDVRAGLAERASSLAQGASETIGSVLGDARTRLNGAAATARSVLGGLGSGLLSLLPDRLSGLRTAIPEAVAGVSERLQAIGPRIAGAAAGARDTVTSAARGFLDARQQEWAATQQQLEQTLEGAKGLARQAGESALALGPSRLRSMSSGVTAAAQGQAARHDEAAAGVADRLRDGACVALGAIGGPCVDQYLPELPGGVKNSARLAATGDLIVPLAEIGVPANLKVAAGAAVEISVLSGVYTVKVDGEAALLLNELVGEDAHVGVAATGGGADGAPAGQMAQAWNALAGGGAPAPAVPAAPAPAAPALGAAAAGAGALASAPNVVTANTAGAEAGGVDAGQGERAEANAGLKGSVHAVWQFNAAAASTSCEGVGGMLTLLAGLGVAAALPSPFNQMAAQAVGRGFMNELQVCRFSAGLHGGAEADLKAGSLADVKLRGSAELMENVELRRDPSTNQLVALRTRTATAELDATALAGFAAGSFERFRAYLSAEGIVRLTLVYDQATDEILPSAVGAAGAISLGARNVDFALLQQLLPDMGDALAELRRLLDGTLPGMTGPREVRVSLAAGRTYEGLEPLGRELRQYFRGPIEGITLDGVIEIVKRNLAALTPIDHIKLELSQTQRRELDLGETEGAGVGEGADLDVTAEHTVSKTWWLGGEEELVEIAAQHGQQAKATVEPGKKKDDDGPKFPSGLSPNNKDDHIPIRWVKPLPAYPDPIRLTPSTGPHDYEMQVPDQFVEPGHSIGVESGFLPEFGKSVQLERVIEEIDRGPGVDRFRSLLTRHGWNGAGFDIDHVQDIGWGGPDEPVNLWPLNSAFNQNAGNRFQQLRLTYSNVPGGGPATPTTTNVRLGDAAQAAGRDNIIGRWFIITSIGP
jgi:hypothetical protein